jgi:hypothetical protein
MSLHPFLFYQGGKIMALKLSTGLRNFLIGEGCLRKAFEDGILNIYSGTSPTEADDAETGVLLARISKSSGVVAANARSTPKLCTVTISGTPDAGDVVKLDIDGTNYQYTLAAADDSVAKVALKVARMLNDSPHVDAIATGSTGVIYVQSRIAGVDFTLTEETSTGITVAVSADIVANIAVDTLKLGVPVLGVISKNADTWSDVALATGTAGYFRLVTSQDLGTDNATDLRIQGTVSTSGADLNMSNINIVSGATQTIDTFTLTEPAYEA